MARAQEFWSSGGVEIRLRDVVLTEVRYPAGLRMPHHWHQPAYLSCVVEGGYQEKVGREWRTVSGRAIVAHPKEEEHAVAFGSGGARILSVRLGDETLDLVREETRNDDLGGWRPSPESAWVVARIRREARLEGPGSRLALEGLVLQLLASGLRIGRGRASPGSVRRAQELIHEGHALPSSLQEIASASGVHPVHLAKAFRRHTGSTVGAYIRRLRVERAVALIEAGEMTLGQIAVECGFSDQPHLTRTFKAHTGSTPAQYRESVRRG